VVIDDLHSLCTGLGPTKTDSVLVIDPNRVLPRPISPEFLEVEARKRQGPERDGRIQTVQGTSSLPVEQGWEGIPGCFGVFAVEDVLGTPVPKRDDQGFFISSSSWAH